MGDDSRNLKRKELTPDTKQEREKVYRQYDSINDHPSILSLASPTNTLNIAKKCEAAGITEAIGKIDVETVYKLVVDLSNRVSSLENQISQKDEELFSLRRDHASLEKQLSDIRTKSSEIPLENDEDVQFLAVMKKEVPALSDHVAKNENEIRKLENKVKELSEPKDRDDAMGDEAQHVQINDDVQQLIAAHKEDRESFEKQNRRSHLEREQQSQYTMRETIRVTGVPFKQGENTNELICRIAFSLGVHITNEDISVSHRTGRRYPGRPRAIICKFTRRDTKYAILRNKKLAKNITQDDDGNPVKIFVDEKLTPMRANVCKFLREKKIQHRTHDGKIFIQKENSTDVTVLDTPDDWMNWDTSVQGKIDLGIFPKL